jgi:hypothetical protein
MGRLTRFCDWWASRASDDQRPQIGGSKTVEIHKVLVYYGEVFGGKALSCLFIYTFVEIRV